METTMEMQTNWDIESDLELHEIIQESIRFPAGGLEELLDEDKCISLRRRVTGRRNAEDCEIRLFPLPPPSLRCDGSLDCVVGQQTRHGIKFKYKMVSGVMLLSEARVVEVYTGPHDEYYKTVHGQLLGDFEDSQIYRCEVVFVKPKETVMLKLKSTCDMDSVWIYAFHVMCTFDSSLGGSRFSSDHLTEVLEDKNIQMSKEAVKFRDLLQAFNRPDSNECEGNYGMNNPMALMKMLFNPMMSAPRHLSARIDLKERNENNRINGNVEAVDCSKHEVDNENVRRDNIFTASQSNSNQNMTLNDSCSRCDTQKGRKNNMESYLTESLLNNECESTQKMTENIQSQCSGVTDDKSSYTQAEQQGGLPPILDAIRGGVISVSDMKGLLEAISDPGFSISSVADQPISPPVEQKTDDAVKRAALPDKDLHAAPLTSASHICLYVPSTESAAGSEVQHITTSTKGLEESKENKSGAACSEIQLKRIEDIIDKKLLAMEERLLQRMEEKLSENAKENALKLERIESLMSKICKNFSENA